MGGDYKPGNVSRPGHLYNPLPFPEFADVPYQRAACEERFDLISKLLPRPFKGGTLLDIGCHTGYNCFRFREKNFQCTGIEADPLTAEIAADVDQLKKTQVRFINSRADANMIRSLGHFDVVLFLSTFQWVVHFDGFDAAVALLAEVQRNCDCLFFETSMGQEGKMKLPQLPDARAIHDLLRSSGAHGNVDCLGAMQAPGGPSHQQRLIFRSHNRREGTARDLTALSPRDIAQVGALTTSENPLYHKRNDHFESAVFRAKTSDGRSLAIKLVRPMSDLAKGLLPREHEFLNKLSGEIAPQLIGFGFHKDRYFLISEWIEGEMLSAPRQAEDLDSDTIRQELFRLEEALRSHNIRHRDIRPQNLIHRDGRLYLLDFGWSCWADEVGCPLPDQIADVEDGIALRRLAIGPAASSS
ncbi:class I SAM-dependent methyltransferase [Dongia deserti]|uniref:class I SAM-dependent methyltransferase n=1 Tax=Dongia deserti TaxID=2268030 RepID=UPI002549489C|nr:class I SAM-dependent methyltransferase [Dongia deserti]